VKTLIDVRELPLSRKKGFSKKKLNEALAENGIQYIHLKSLGDPKPLRDKIKKKAISWQIFEIQYRKHAISNMDSVEKVVELNHNNRVCMMCFERDHTECHRSIISDIIQKDFAENVYHL
jgi:uncharacterized protein (DUF488 family)